MFHFFYRSSVNIRLHKKPGRAIKDSCPYFSGKKKLCVVVPCPVNPMVKKKKDYAFLLIIIHLAYRAEKLPAASVEAVRKITVVHMLKNDPLKQLSGEHFYYCGNPDGEVIYFSTSPEVSYTTDQVEWCLLTCAAFKPIYTRALSSPESFTNKQEDLVNCGASRMRAKGSVSAKPNRFISASGAECMVSLNSPTNT